MTCDELREWLAERGLPDSNVYVSLAESLTNACKEADVHPRDAYIASLVMAEALTHCFTSDELEQLRASAAAINEHQRDHHRKKRN